MLPTARGAPSHTTALVQMILMSSWEQQKLDPHMGNILSNEQYIRRITLLGPGQREDERYRFFDAFLDWLDDSSGGDTFWGVANKVTIDELAAK